MTFETTVQPRHRDLDPMGHVNNAVYATYFEHARTAFFREEARTNLEETNAALVSLSIEFERSIDRLTTVTVELSVAELGTTSATFAYRLRADDETVATGESVWVALDDDGAPTQIARHVREAFERHHDA